MKKTLKRDLSALLLALLLAAILSANRFVPIVSGHDNDHEKTVYLAPWATYEVDEYSGMIKIITSFANPFYFCPPSAHCAKY
jgi:hypothetical protein